jgi:uncharacterized membrane protein
MRSKNRDLLITILVVALNGAWMQVPNRPLIVGIILALPLILFLPGYTLTQALFRKKPSRGEPDQIATHPVSSEQAPQAGNKLKLGHAIGGMDQLILSLGLSMAIDILVGFVLNILPIGLQGLSWTVALGLLTVLFALIALFMRRNTPASSTKTHPVRITLPDALFLGLAIFIIINAIWLAAIRPPDPQPSFTQFWILPANPNSKVCAVSIGIQSFELTSTQYDLTVAVNSKQIEGKWSTITLAPQQKWTQIVPLTPEAQNDLQVEAQLYRLDQPSTVYRDVHLTFHVSTKFQNGQAQVQCTLGT